MPEVDVHVKFRCANAPPDESLANMTTEEKTIAEKAADDDLDGRDPCSICGRKFLRSRLSVHEEICRKNAAKGPRPKFNSAKQRAIQDEDAVPTRSRSINRRTREARKPVGAKSNIASTGNKLSGKSTPGAKTSTNSNRLGVNSHRLGGNSNNRISSNRLDGNSNNRTSSNNQIGRAHV